MTIAIIDYGSGNLRSATKAFEWAVKAIGSSQNVLLTSDPEEVATADRIVLPGVGAYGDCKRGLDAVPGLKSAVIEVVQTKGNPFLGICVGTQLMATRGLEKADDVGTPGFGWVTGDVVELEPDEPGLKIPQIGWNTIKKVRDHAIVKDIATGDEGLHAYFVHSYHIACENPEELIATTDYGGAVTAIVGRDNMVGTQFHPEKSQKLGLALIKNFIEWNP